MGNKTPLHPRDAQVMARLGWVKANGNSGYVKLINTTFAYEGDDTWEEALEKVQDNPYCCGDLKQPVYAVTCRVTETYRIPAWTEEEALNALQAMLHNKEFTHVSFGIIPNSANILINPDIDVDTRGG